MKTLFNETLVVILSILWMLQSLPIGRPDANFGGSGPVFTNEPSYNLLNDDLEVDIYKNWFLYFKHFYFVQIEFFMRGIFTQSGELNALL